MSSLVARCVALAALLGAACAPADRRAPERPAPDLTTRVQSMAAWREAGDTASWHRVVADAAIFSGPGVQVDTTAAMLIIVASNAITRPKIVVSDISARTVGTAASATYLETVTRPPGSQAGMLNRFRVTDTFVLLKSGWTLVASARTRLAWRASIPYSVDRLGPLTGLYVLGETDSAFFSVGNSGELMLRGPYGAPNERLFAQDDSTFFADGDPRSWIFRRVAQGRGIEVILRADDTPDLVYHRDH